ncbi:MAG: hypothetical protein ABIN89_29865 [Chitinophagaceae bacterium]
MNQETDLLKDGHTNADKNKKNKSGHPKAERDCSTRKVTLYLTEEEYALITEFAKTAWHTFNYSGAARYLVLNGLREWARKGRRIYN